MDQLIITGWFQTSANRMHKQLKRLVLGHILQGTTTTPGTVCVWEGGRCSFVTRNWFHVPFLKQDMASTHKQILS